MRCRNPLFSLERWAPNVRRGTTPRLKPGAFSLHPGVWTTTTRTSRMACCAPQCGHPARIRSASVSILRRGLSPTTPYRNFRQPVWVCTPNGGGHRAKSGPIERPSRCFLRKPRVAVWLLHARYDSGRSRAAHPHEFTDPVGDCRGPLRQSVPLHWLCPDH